MLSLMLCPSAHRACPRDHQSLFMNSHRKQNPSHAPLLMPVSLHKDACFALISPTIISDRLRVLVIVLITVSQSPSGITALSSSHLQYLLYLLDLDCCTNPRYQPDLSSSTDILIDAPPWPNDNPPLSNITCQRLLHLLQPGTLRWRAPP